MSKDIPAETRSTATEAMARAKTQAAPAAGGPATSTIETPTVPYGKAAPLPLRDQINHMFRTNYDNDHSVLVYLAGMRDSKAQLAKSNTQLAEDVNVWTGRCRKHEADLRETRRELEMATALRNDAVVHHQELADANSDLTQRLEAARHELGEAVAQRDKAQQYHSEIADENAKLHAELHQVRAAHAQLIGAIPESALRAIIAGLLK